MIAANTFDGITSFGAPADPTFRHNFCFDAFDPQRNVGLFIQLTRWPRDPSIWREQVRIYLPDHDYLVHRGWGCGNERHGVAGALLKLHCEVPDRRWRIRYRGPIRRATAAELSDGPLRERIPLLIDLDATFESDVAIGHLGSTAPPGPQGTWHIEQPGQVAGRLMLEGQTSAFQGPGHRHQSRSQLRVSEIFDHCWMHGAFPDGRAFLILSARARQGNAGPIVPSSHALLWSDGQICRASCNSAPLLGDTAAPLTAPPERFSFTLDSELGSMTVHAQAKRCLPHSTSSEGEWLDGVVLNDASAHLVAYERATLFECSGTIGVGHTEQSRRVR